MAIGQGFHTKPSPTLGSLPAGLNDLKLGNTISMAPRMVSFDLVFYELLEKVTFVDFQQREQGFDFWTGFPSQKSENYEPP